MKIRAAVLESFGAPLEVQELELAEPRAGEVLVRLVACGVCHTDLFTASGADPSGYSPAVLGHEGAGVVERVGDRERIDGDRGALPLAEAIARHDPKQAVLVEVNIAREPQKSGVAPEHALELVTEVAKLLDLQGLMGMGPSHGDPRPVFDELRLLHDDAEQLVGHGLPILSMGMSGDFEAALAAGSTMLRLGQALFGPRAT